MKNIFFCLASLFVLCGFTAQAQSPYVSLTLTCPGAAVTPGNNFNVDATYGYSNVSGNLVVVVNYNNTLVSFCGSPGFATAPVAITSGSTTTLTYTFPASAGANQTGAIQMCFSFLCPQTCFGNTLSANFSGNISSPTLSNVPSNSCTTSGTVANNWTGQNTLHSYDCVANTVTFKLHIAGSTCYKINNPNITISPSMGTLLGTSYGMISGNTITLSAPMLPAPSYYDIYYTVQLPCATTAPAVLTCGAVLNGDNCGNPTANLFTFGNASFSVPATTTTAASIWQATGSNYNVVQVYNTGSTPMNLTLTTLFALANITSVVNSTTQPSGVTGNLTLFNCAGVAAAPVAFPPPTTVPVATLTSKATYTINNLQAGQWYTVYFYFDKTASCTGVIPDCDTFVTSGNYSSNVTGAACNCTADTAHFLNTATSVYCPKPEIGCNGASSDANSCKKDSDVVHICFGFYNYGTAALTNGVLTFPLPSYLNYSGNLTYNASPGGVSAAVVGGNLVITLPPGIAPGSGVQTVCFDATVNATALNGLFTYYFSISGSNLAATQLWCPYQIRICEDPKVEIEKLVKGGQDAAFSTTGSGMAGTIATYRITVKNVGNTPINSIEVIDRTPELLDKTITGCTGRGSQFSMLPNGIFMPAALSAAATYSASPSAINNLPPAWTGLPGCNVSSSFSAAVANTVKINIPGTVLPFTNYTFDMQVLVPAGATAGQTACNTMGVKCYYLDIANNPHPLAIIESGPACLTIAPPPCDNCKGLVGQSSLTMNPGSTTSPGSPFVTQTGFVTITTLMPVQEVHLSVADLQYHWNDPNCVNCKAPTITRGCIFPQSISQTVGTLVWDDYTGNGIPNATPINDCPEELIWKLGVMLNPGTHTIPIQLTLPKATIPNCCTLVLDKFDIKVSLKDKDCKVCDAIVKPATDDCCTGSHWLSQQITWDVFTHPDLNTGNAQQQARAKKSEEQLQEAVRFNKLVQDKVIDANVVPLYGVTNVQCDSTYKYPQGATRTFAATYACNPSLKNCDAQVFISITTISGDYINVVSQPSPFTQIFNLPGVYKVMYVVKCGGKVCNTCEFTLVIEKNCCLGIQQISPSTITTNSFGSPTSTVNLASPVPGHYTSVNNAIVSLRYQCTGGCTPMYDWVRKRNGVTIASGTSASSPLSFAPPSSGEDQIIITIKCGAQNCYKTEQFYLGCNVCSIIVGPHTGGVKQQ